MRRGAMGRPGFGSAVARLLAIANAVLWALAMPEFIEVWGYPDGSYTIPSELHTPRVTMWIVLVVMLATAALVVVGFVQRQRSAVTPWVRRVDWVVAGLQIVWAVMYVWSFVLRERRLANQEFGTLFGGTDYTELTLAVLGVISATLLVRDARATEPPGTREPSTRARGFASPVARALVALAVLVALGFVIAYMAGLSRGRDGYAFGPLNVSRGPLLIAAVLVFSLAMLALGGLWRRRSAQHGTVPRRAGGWLRAAAVAQAACAVVVAWVYVTLQGEVHVVPTLVEPKQAVGLAAIAGVAAALHARDARDVSPRHRAQPASTDVT